MLLFSLLIWNNQTTQLVHCLKLAWNEQKVYRKGQHALIFIAKRGVLYNFQALALRSIITKT